MSAAVTPYSSPDAPWDVMPRDDAMTHAQGDACECGPSVKSIRREDGHVSWIAHHHRLDGRGLEP